MPDASEEGGAVVSTMASLEEVQEESRWSPRGCWTLLTGRVDKLRCRGISLVAAEHDGELEMLPTPVEGSSGEDDVPHASAEHACRLPTVC